MRQRNIVLYGGSFNPPGNNHLAVVKAVIALPEVEELVIIPCGLRPEINKRQGLPLPIQRKTLCGLTFGDLPKVRFDFSDLEKDFTRTWDLQERFSILGNISHVIGTDLIKGGARGESEIQTRWYRGKELWQKLNFIVVGRAGYEIKNEDLPPRSEFLSLDIKGSSTEIRNLLSAGKSITSLVTIEVERYIKNHKLYQKG
jgi:nicotinate-nucleotide adenylyltransferase